MAESRTIRGQRARFWAENGFGEGGGYDQAWQEASFGGIPYAVPNPRARAGALRVHDLHHVLTGYGADWRGESEIAGWELGSGGGGRYGYAWFIAIFGFVVGLIALPVRTWLAFRRGRGSSNLYALDDPMQMLDENVVDAKARLSITDEPRSLRSVDVAAFVLLALIAVPLGLLFVAGTPLLVLFAFTRMRCPLRHGALPC